jgi:glycosyltransferase involved in cell wall biosynthesis
VNTLFIPADWRQKEKIKDQYSTGKEYFLYSGTIDTQHNLINLLKAFSFFKKRQKSNMQLILASTAGIKDAVFTKSLASYKYRTEVQLLERCSMETLAAVTAAAYALVYPVLYEGFCTSAAEAMQCGTPVITTNSSSLPEICGDAALYANSSDFNDIADKMMLLFKDEDKRNELIIKGLQQATQFNREKTAVRIWELLADSTNL